MTADTSPLLAFAVGHPGEMGWQCIRAGTVDAAKDAFVIDHLDGRGADCELLAPDEIADRAACLDCVRVPAWDTLTGDPSRADWLRAGLGTYCDYCEFESHAESGAVIIEDHIVLCGDCAETAFGEDVA